jgi:excisionase family DNA binding protein
MMMSVAPHAGTLPNGLMAVSEVAQVLKVTTETVRRYIREGKLPATKVRTVGLRTQWGVSRADLEAFGGR